MLLSLCIKELIKTLTTIDQKLLSEYRGFIILPNCLEMLQVKFEADDLLAEITIEYAILLLILSLSENSFDN